MVKYVDIDVAKEAVRRAECNANWYERRFDAEFIENALDFIPAADVAQRGMGCGYMRKLIIILTNVIVLYAASLCRPPLIGA